MNPKIFLALLAMIVVSTTQSQNIIVKSDMYGEVLESGGTITKNTYRYPPFRSDGGFPINEAIWIWNQDWNPQEDRTQQTHQTVFEEFPLFCDTPVTVYASADNQFKAYLNGEIILQGNSWGNVQKTTIDPKTSTNIYTCGQKNTFKIAGTNYAGKGGNNPAGIIYAIIQDTSCLSPRSALGYITCEDNDYTNSDCSCKGLTPNERFFLQLLSCCGENYGYIKGKTGCQWVSEEPQPVTSPS